MAEQLFNLCVTFFLIHELDAVYRSEWRIFPGLSRLSDGLGREVFVFAHVPLFWVVLDGCYVSDAQTRWQQGLAAFALVHVILHVIATRHPRNEFAGTSWVWIVGAGLLGGAYLLTAA